MFRGRHQPLQPAGAIPAGMRSLLAGVLCLALAGCTASRPEMSWELHTIAGHKAYRQGNFAEAHKQINIALKATRAFGTQDPRYATTLNNLAELYRAQGRYAEAEPLYRRSLGIREKALGPVHTDIVKSLDNYAALLRMAGREAQATRMERRADIIRSKLPRWAAR